MCDDDNSFDTSIDSGISLETPSGDENKVEVYKHILFVLERDKILRSEQRKNLSQISDKKLRCKGNQVPCNVCCVHLDVENIKNCIKCINCQKLACRGELCSIWIPRQSGWECRLCNQSNDSFSKSREWNHPQINSCFATSTRSEPTLSRDHNSPIEFDRTSETASSYGAEQKDRVRELVEETLADMLGGSLDNISVGQLYKNRE